MIDVFQKMLAPLRRELAHLIARALVKLADDSGELQVVQLGLLEGEVRDKVERLQQYGFTSVPLAPDGSGGPEALVLFARGMPENAVVIAVEDRRHRKTGLAAGEVALYTDEGHVLHLKRGRIVATAPELRLGSDSATNFVALANLVLDRLNQIKTAFDGHTHLPGTFANGGGPVAGVSGGATAMGSIGSVAAGKVKAE